jgi:hypothetical protein
LGWSLDIYWSYVDPDDYVPGEMRMMTRAMLTEAGRAIVAEAAEGEDED